jgi:hypothetical protein
MGGFCVKCQLCHSGAIMLVVMGCGGSWVGEGDDNGAGYWVVVLLSCVSCM